MLKLDKLQTSAIFLIFLLRRGAMRYQGVLYEYHYQYYWSQSQTFPQSVQLLGYRGIFYSSELQSSNRSPEASQPKHYRYYLGWQKNRHQYLLRFPNLLLSHIYYKRGFTKHGRCAIAANRKLWKLGRALKSSFALPACLEFNFAQIKVN